MGDLVAWRKGLEAAAPAVTLLLAVVLLVVPLRLFEGFLPTPWLPMIVIFLFAVNDPDSLPAPIVFGTGILHDLLYGQGLGVWAASYLVLQYVVLTQYDFLQGRPARLVWVAFGVAAVIASIVLYLLRSLLAGGWMPLLPLGYQLLITVAFYPLASMLYFAIRRRAVRRTQEARGLT